MRFPRPRPHARALMLVIAIGGLLATAIVPADGQSAQAAGPAFANASFESPRTKTYAYHPSKASWSFSKKAGIQRNGSRWRGAKAPDGAQTAFVQGAGGALGVIAQSVELSSGTYTVSFRSARRKGGVQPVQVTVDGRAVGTWTPAGTAFATVTTPAFAVGAGSHRVALRATIGSGDRTSFIDDVTIATAPEASPTPDPGTRPPASVAPSAAPSSPAPVQSSPAGVLADASFESPATTTYAYRPDGAGWTFTGSTGVQRNGSVWSAAAAPDGEQTAFVQGADGAVSQQVTLSAGTWAVAFQAARRTGQTQPVQVSVDGTSIGTYRPDGNSFASVTTASFTVGAGPHTIAFQGTDGSADRTTFLDAVAIVPATATTDPAPAVPDIDLTGYRRTFSEDFDSLSVSTEADKGASTWYAYPPYGPAGNYSDSAWSADALSVQDGALHERAYRTSADQDGKVWRTGNISSVDPGKNGFAQTYGYFEARIKMPASGTGSWPAFWLMSTTSIDSYNGTPTRFSELDVAEWYGTTWSADPQQTTLQQVSHNYEADRSQNQDGALIDGQVPMPGNAKPWEGYHVYGIQVDRQHITWYVDGVQTNRIATDARYLTGPYYMMISYALGSGWPLDGVVDGSAVQVDWVRAYALPGD